ncbi:hypothetical protein DFH09DRAFT_1469760 [Mycena vulgaris]|nr:hypothetical protein DFH09DRAFT_1469760 [Mycena vulgaris]
MFLFRTLSSAAGVVSLLMLLILLYISAHGNVTMPYWVVFIVLQTLFLLGVATSKLSSESAAAASRMYTLAMINFITFSVAGSGMIQPIPFEDFSTAARALFISLIGETTVGYLALIAIVSAILVRNEPADLGSLGGGIECLLERLERMFLPAVSFSFSSLRLGGTPDETTVSIVASVRILVFWDDVDSDLELS